MISRLLISFSFVFLYTAQPTTTTFGFTNETDRQALLAIKDLIPGDPLRVFSSWNNTLHFCNWQGVTCGRKHQRVTVLNLSSLKLAGSLSPHVGNLTFLKVIDIKNNSFHGIIPQEVGRLFRLQYLYLLNNSFRGEVPINISYCSELTVVNLIGNNLEGKIPIELGSLSKLSRLSLSANPFTGTIPRSFGNLSALTILSLARNNLEGSIPSELGQLSQLQFFQLGSNKLSGMVPKQLYNLSSIYYFSVVENQLHGNLSPDLGFTLPKLQFLFLGNNQFSGPIPTSITNSSGLVQIDFVFNAFTGPLPKNFEILQDLQLISFGFNLLESDSSFLTSLTNCTNLRQIWFSQTHFKGALPNSIANLSTNLNTFDMGQNYISGSIPPGIGNLISLEFLALHENMLTGNIPDSIGKLSNLKGLYLYINKLSGKIPSSIGNITRLSVLHLGDNLLEGSIPVSLSRCIYLAGLDLSNNHLNGTIPEQVIGISSLSIGLFLGSNNLTGPLPSNVGNMKNLNALDISENNLSGEIPSTLGNCLVLELLYLEGNLFEGSIPPSLREIRGIQVLDLSRNNLSGQIPQFLEVLDINNLNLSYNKFEGEVPIEGVFGNISAFSVKGNSKLCGGIKPLQLPVCPTKISEQQGKPFPHGLTIIITSVVLSTVLLLACLYAILHRIRSSKRKPSSDSTLKKQYLRLSYADLLHATDGFSSTNLLGEGRYGSVYKGVLNSDEQTVAVKVLSLQQRGAHKTFMAECEALRNVRHRNLIKIITSCSSIDFKGNEFKALIFEFMPNGSLESWLHPSSAELQDSEKLNMIQRLNIAIDVASGLDYLHHHCETPIVHCDLKPSNILLDNDLTAHVGDFGLARFLLATTGTSIHAQRSSIGVRGTVGYVAPEHGLGGELSTFGDVYSYGILLLEMFMGKNPTDSMFMDNFNLHNFAKMAFPDRLMEIVDPQLTLEEEDESIRTSQSSRGNVGKIEECLASILRIGVICSSDLPSERMDMKDVLRELQVIRDVFLSNGRRGRVTNSQY